MMTGLVLTTFGPRTRLRTYRDVPLARAMQLDPDDPRYALAVASVRMQSFHPALYAVLGGVNVGDSPLVPNRPAEPLRPVTEEQRDEVRELWAEAEADMDGAVQITLEDMDRFIEVMVASHLQSSGRPRFYPTVTPALAGQHEFPTPERFAAEVALAMQAFEAALREFVPLPTGAVSEPSLPPGARAIRIREEEEEP